MDSMLDDNTDILESTPSTKEPQLEKEMTTSMLHTKNEEELSEASSQR